jgi:hypothetical protein
MMNAPFRYRWIMFAGAGFVVALVACWPAMATAEHCTGQGCGTNTPEMYGTGIVGLHTEGMPNNEDVVLYRGSLQPFGRSTCPPDAKNLGVFDGELAGFNDAHVMRCSGPEMLDSMFEIGVPPTPSYHQKGDPARNDLVRITIKIAARGTVTTWHRVGATFVPTYRLVWAHGGNSLCGGAAPMEPWQTGHPVQDKIPANLLKEWTTANDHLFVVQGESYTQDAGIYQSGPAWFNLACMRSAIAKSRLLGFNPMDTSPTRSTGSERVATLKMLTARYVDEVTYTAPGMPLRYERNPRVDYYGVPPERRRIEAYWGATGTLCLTHRRTWRNVATSWAELMPELLGSSGPLPPSFLKWFFLPWREMVSVEEISRRRSLATCAGPPAGWVWTVYTSDDHIPD